MLRDRLARIHRWTKSSEIAEEPSRFGRMPLQPSTRPHPLAVPAADLQHRLVAGRVSAEPALGDDGLPPVDDLDRRGPVGLENRVVPVDVPFCVCSTLAGPTRWLA
jgi:hypothetical protein